MPVLGLLLRFLLAAVIGAGGALAAAAVLTPNVASQARPGPAYSVDLTTELGEPAAFGLVAIPDAQPVALQALPDDKTLTLLAYAEPGTTPSDPFSPAWINSAGHPRVPMITQFDGGPLQNVNCVMAAGAMLARLTFGIVTTGSQVRSFAHVPHGGTTLHNLNRAMNEGWGVQFSIGYLTPLQLRSLLYAGAGAVVLVKYGEIPAQYSLQPGFVAGHGIYLDGFHQAGPDGEAAYFVGDPLGRTWSGYKGKFIPARFIERAGTVFGGGRIMTAWGFPGGGQPAHYPPLPTSDWPSEDQPPAGEEPTPPPLPEPGDVPVTPENPGDTPPAVPVDPGIRFDWPVKTGIFRFDPDLVRCLGPSAPVGCPYGLAAIVSVLTAATPTIPPAVVLGDVTLLFADSVQPGVLRVIFSVPEGATAGLQYWPSDGSGSRLLAPSAIEPMILDGRVVQVASIPVETGVGYDFVATAAAEGARGISQVGTIGP
jgi:hypothetical protein